MIGKTRVLIVVSVLLGLLAGCVTPGPVILSGGPQPPIRDPNIFGRPNRNVQPIADLPALQACVDAGVPAYGVTLQTTNVRSEPSLDACRVGKLPRGTLVEITNYAVDTNTHAAATAASAAAPAAAEGPTVGYVEDIQPIFVRACTVCHSAIARTLGLQTTDYGTLMEGSINGPVVVPGDPEASKLWEMIGSNRMPLTGPLPESEKELVRTWIEQGAAEHRGASALEEVEHTDEGIWLSISEQTELTTVPDACEVLPDDAGVLVSSDLILPVSCGAAPNPNDLNQLLARYGLPGAQNVVANRPAAPASPLRGQREASTAAGSGAAEAVAPAPVAAPAGAANAGQVGIQAAAIGLPAPSDADPYLIPQGGFCMERRFAKNSRGITAISFAPDGRMFLALDSALTGEVDPLILYDAYHPSRSIAVYDWANDSGFNEIFTESSRITGLDYSNGALYISRAGEVGRIADGGGYEKLADGFAVNSQLFHANNGIVVSDGWVYVSAGGMRDGYVEGPIVGVSEQGAQDIVSNGNPYAARIVRAPLDALLSTRSISAFSTAARGVRNPYGITRDAAGRIWFTDNGATNVPDEISAGDEVNVLYPGAIGPFEESTPHYGFPLALGGEPKEWYSKPVVDLRNSAAPTGISAAYGTIFYAAYGVDPGLYRLGRTASGAVTTERILLGWPILAVATAPDGALWIGMGDGGLYRITPGCGN